MTNNNNDDDDDKETPLNELLLPTPAKLRGRNSEWKTLLAAYRRAAAAATVETKDDTTKNDDDDDAAEATTVPQKSLRELSLSDTNGDAAADVTPHGADEGRDNDDGPRTSGSHCNRGNNPVATPPSRSFRNKTELVFIRGTGGNGKSFLTKKLSHYLQTSSSSSRQFHNFVTGQFDRNASNDDDGSDGGGTKGTVPYAAFRMAFNRLLEQFREETEPCGIRRERAAADDDDDDPLKRVVKEALGTGEVRRCSKLYLNYDIGSIIARRHPPSSTMTTRITPRRRDRRRRCIIYSVVSFRLVWRNVVIDRWCSYWTTGKRRTLRV